MHAAPLAQLSNLTDLNISYADVPDLWAIRKLPLVNLTLSLHFTWHKYEDDFLQPIEEIQTLESFSIDGGINQAGVEVLSRLKNLRHMHIWPGPDELDLMPLCQLKNLTEITLLDKVKKDHNFFKFLNIWNNWNRAKFFMVVSRIYRKNKSTIRNFPPQ